MTRCHPPKSGIRLLPRRATSIAPIRNSAAVENPWLSMYSVAPAPPTDVIAKMPSTMKPKWLTEV